MTENKQCAKCKTNFTVDDADFEFYKKIAVPAPTFCPDCRRQRRILWRNERSLYKRNCDLCKKGIISMYSSDKPFVIYCPECWWSDKWDPMQYGQIFDPAKPFFTQFKELMNRVPRISLIQKDVVDSAYTNYPIHIKNCYLVFGGHDIEDSSYISVRSHFLKNCIDVSYSYSSEFCYECFNVSKCHTLTFSQDCEGCRNSAFLYDCRNCSDCFGCAGLRGKSYYIFNQPYTKEEYHKELAKINAGSYGSLQTIKEKFASFILQYPRKYAMILQSVNVTGDHIAKAKNCRQCFAVSIDMEDAAYCWLIDRSKDVYDVSIGYSLELAYEGLSILEGQNMRMSTVSWGSHDTTYVDNCHDCGELFGCVGLRNKNYCILNTQYSKEEYQALTEKIISQMNTRPYVDKQGKAYKYGEFFPAELAPFCYNESIAQEYFPLTKEHALTQGYSWKELEARAYAITNKPPELADHIKDVPDSITQEIIACAHARPRESASGQYQSGCVEQCATAFKITPAELALYRRMNIPLPRLCPNCRHYQRLAKQNPFKLYSRTCNKCQKAIETTYAPDRPELIYCESCYQTEVI